MKAGCAIGKRARGVGQHGQQRRPVAAPDPKCVAFEWQGKRMSIRRCGCDRFQPHRSFALEAGVGADAAQGGGGIEQTSGRRTGRTVQPVRPSLMQGFGRERRGLAGFPQQRCRGAPRLASGLVAAGQVKRPQCSGVLPETRCAGEGFAAPQAVIPAETDAVPGKHDPVFYFREFPRHGGGMGMVMPDLA